MSAGNRIIAVLGIGLVAAAGFGLYSLGMNRGMQMGAGTASSTPMTDQANGGEGAAAPADRKVLYWHDPMVPGQKFDKPGKSPFMDMQLVPVYAGNDGDESRVSISPRVQQNLGVRTVEVVRGALTPTLEVVGSVAYNDRDVALVQARTTGFVEKLSVRAPLDAVRRGQVLGEMVVPEWSAAQEEYLSARRIAGAAGGLPALADAARQRMHLVGLSDEQIAAIEATGEIRPRFKIIAPATGVITELSAREGMTVMAGAPLFRINGLATVWINAEVPENFAAQVRPGIAVEARTPALPGIVFNGKVSAILPDVNAATRTLKARIEVANRKGQLVPGMFATVKFASPARKDTLLVPTEAVIATGKRTVVMVALADGKFAPTDVELGLENNGQTEVRKGLEAGQKVVVSGQFLIDSEASLRSTVTRMSDAPMVGASASGGAGEAGVHHGVGRVEAIGKDEITLSHEPIASLKWGPMTMGF
ncbi:MAG: efflux RND transporter periplasmic adaptor subunit, partial [Betaproteobacteria bacterium]